MKHEALAGIFSHFHNHPEVLKVVNMNGNIFRDILLIIISKGTNNCVQHVFEKKTCISYVIIPHFQLSYFNERLDFCDKTSKRSKGLIMQQ